MELTEKINRENGLAVIPWGFGKWMGSKGKILDDFVKNVKMDFYMGDNSNRPIFIPIPKQIKNWQSDGKITLSGSDPLPFKSEFRKAGSFGIYIYGDFDSNTPYKSFYNLIKDPDIQIHHFGKYENLMRFIFNQFKMQIIKRLN